MEILYSDLEDEVRDGFYVDSLMKCCWMAQLQVLEEIDRICCKYQIQYQAEWGTLLAAIRHGGFIPWDDDMDISMKREDYKRFLKIAAEELPKDYYIINHNNDEDYWDVMTRIINHKYIGLKCEYLDKNCNFPFAAGIDIFPLDFLPPDKEEGDTLKELVNYVKSTADVYGMGQFEEKELKQRIKEIEQLCNVKIKRKKKLREQLYDIVENLYSTYQEEESDEIVQMALWVEKGCQAYSKEYYSNTIRVPFEHTTIPVPIAYDSILKKKYGNYMKMVRKGGSHDYPYYKTQIKIMEQNGIFMECFEYEKRVCRKVEKESKKKISLGIESLSILEKAHLGLYKLLSIQELESVIQLLIKCQEWAVQIGENIEKNIIECKEPIMALEEYCELIFQIFELIQAGENLNPQYVFEALTEQANVIKNIFLKEYEAKKKIVFVTNKASHWKSLESIWKSAKEDKNCIVSVVVIPYVYKRIDKSILEEHYEKEVFPEYVEIEDYRTFNLEQYHPDIIYINSPYDEYNYFTNIHPDFYSSKLINYCEKLVYIPWFVISEITREDERGWQSMQHFVTMPGVVNADQVIVQSEQMKQVYVDYLTDWAGEETRGIWEEKICGLGSPLIDVKNDREEIEKTIPESWKSCLYKENGERKKVIFYSMSSASFIDYKEKAVDKLKRVLGIFKENKEEICLLWYWNVTMEDTLRMNYPKLWESFQEIANCYQEEAWGIYETEADRELMVRFSDAYYGDGCVVSQAMVMAEKPVMLENFEC